ncbi:MAG TPA: hypothetical protein VG733_02425 [Chthoniobacteraceae bacterium]|nr:hypothetical protein [Chthoniobacteraceae bacterium]
MRANKFAAGIIAMMCALFPFTQARAGDFQADFDQAGQAYDQAKYSDAERLYESVARGGHYSPQLFYNLGNTEFRLEKYGPAILNYERALSLSPGNPEIEANLAYARAQSGARIAERNWRDDAVMNFSATTYGWAAAVGVWVAIFALAALWLTRAGKTGPVLAAICGVAVLGYSLFAISQIAKNDALAIVTAKSTQARSAPTGESTLTATLPAGSRVWILEQRGAWVYCRLTDSDKEWLPADSIERVRPQNS